MEDLDQKVFDLLYDYRTNFDFNGNIDCFGETVMHSTCCDFSYRVLVSC